MTELDAYHAQESERDFQQRIIDLALLTGWDYYHTHDSRRSIGGFPDLVLAHPVHGLLFWECKVGRAKPRKNQREWLDALDMAFTAMLGNPDAAAERARVVRPADWESYIVPVLKAGLFH